jgi:type IV fimbrial biogenesis protein FimT
MKRRARGFSLLELMIALTMLAILVGLAAPSYRAFTRNNTVTAAHNDLVTSLTLARSEALRRNRTVSVCASADGASCGDATNWNTGWIAFTDRDAAGTIDGTDEVLQVWQPQVDDLLFAADAGFLQYAPTGMGVATLTVDISWSGCTGKRMRRVSVLVTGAVTGESRNCP